MTSKITIGIILITLLCITACTPANKINWDLSDSKPLGICIDGNCPAATCYAELESDAGFYKVFEGEEELEHTITTYSVLPHQTWAMVTCYQEAFLTSQPIQITQNQSAVIDITYLHAPGMQAFVQTTSGWKLITNPAYSSSSCENIEKKTNQFTLSFEELPTSQITIKLEDSDGFCDYASMLWIGNVNIINSKTQTAERNQTEQKEVECSDSQVRGTITFVENRAFVVRGVRTLPAKVGTELFSGDVIAVEEDAAVTIDLSNTGQLKISEKTKFEIPLCTQPEEKGFFSGITKGFGKFWTQMKNLIQGESYEVKTPTAVAGARG